MMLRNSLKDLTTSNKSHDPDLQKSGRVFVKLISNQDSTSDCLTNLAQSCEV